MNNNIQDSPLFIMEREFQLISQDVLLIFDMEGIITDVNNSAVRIFGKNREKLIGTRFVEHFIDPVKANNAVKQVFDTGEVRDYELVIETGDVPNTIVAFNISLYKDQTGKVTGAFAAGYDITRHKHELLEMHYLQHYNRGLIETSLDPLVTFDQEGIILDVNEATIRATGRGRDELIETPFADYFTDPDKAYKGAMLTFETGEVRDYELVMKAKDGTETFVSYNASVYKDQTGKVVGAFAAARDITERKGAEQEIQNLQRYNRGLIETSLDPLVTFDQEGTILDVNEATIRATGRGKEELIGTPFADYFTDPDNAYKGAMLTFKTGEVRDYELVMKARDGTETIVSYNASVYKDQTGKVVGAFAAARDITERKGAEQEIQNLQRYNRGLIETSLDPLVTFDQEGTILDVNEATIRATGRGKEELIGTPFADYFTDPDNAYKGAMLTFKTGEVRDYELVMKARDGTETIVSYNASVYKDQTGKVVGAFAAARDITERKGAEQEIQNLQRYNRGLIETSLDPLVTFDQEGTILDVNEATIRATGRGKEELIGTPFADYFTDPDNAYKGAMLTFKTGEVRDYELVMKARDGTETIVSYNASVYKDQTGKVVGAFAAARDITERKGAEQEIQNLQRYNRGLIETSLDPLVTFDQEGTILDVNEATIRATGRGKEELIGTPFADYFTDPDNAYKGAMLTFKTGEVRDYELVMKARDGTETIVSYNASVYKDQTGKVVGAFAAARDITERKGAEQEIQNLQRYNRGLIETSLDPLVTFDQEGIILDVNEATIRATGRSREELIGTPFADYFTDPDNAYEGAMLTFETGVVRDYELVMKARDGTETVVSYNASVYKDQTGKVVGAFAAARDITERKGAEQEIQNLHRYTRGLIEVSLDPLVTFDQEGVIMDVNRATVRAIGRSRDELIGTPFADYFTEPDKAYKGAMLTFETGEVRDYELVMKAKDGTETIVAYNASVYKDQTGEVVGVFAAARDITERKKAEIALSESKAEIDLIFQIAADGMCVIDADYNIVKVNKSFTLMVDMDEDEIIGKKCFDIFSGELCYSEDCPLKKLKKGERFAEHESVKKRPDGKEIPVIVNAARLENNGKFVGIVEDFKDISERKQAEEEIRELQRYNRGLIEVSLDPLVTFDHGGIIMDVNTATIRATGRSRDELIGTPFADYFTDPEKAYTGAMKVFETGEVRDYELVMKARDGTETTVAYNATVYKDQTGTVVGAFAAARDITLQKKAEHELQETVNRLEAYTTRINSLMVTMLDQITEEKTKGVILDISGLPPDVEVTEPLIKIAEFARQLGATCIVTGIKKEAVQRLTDAGANLAPITTEKSLLDGLRYTIAMIDEEE